MNNKAVRVSVIAGLSIILFSSSAFGWTATNLGGGNWAIGCANGTNWSYHGSSAGLDIVGPALCPGGIVGGGQIGGGQNLPRDIKGVAIGIPISFDRSVIKNKKEIGDSGLSRITRYPPKGYPCLGCEPCNDGSGDYCDISNKNIVFFNQPAVRKIQTSKNAEAIGGGFKK